MNVNVTVDIRELTRGLDMLGENFKSAIGSAIRKSALLIEGQSKINSPVDTGRMRSSIFSDIEPMKATIMPTVDYAVYVHEGTKYMKARPFLRDAVKQKEGDMVEVFEKELGKAVDNFNK
jgi:HK97 gp10 family phage protein